MRPHEKIVEQLVAVVLRRGVEPVLGATGPRDQLVAILQIAVLDHFFRIPDFAVARAATKRAQLAE
jgi:hypothetical protein